MKENAMLFPNQEFSEKTGGNRGGGSGREGGSRRGCGGRGATAPGPAGRRPHRPGVFSGFVHLWLGGGGHGAAGVGGGGHLRHQPDLGGPVRRAGADRRRRLDGGDGPDPAGDQHPLCPYVPLPLPKAGPEGDPSPAAADLPRHHR